RHLETLYMPPWVPPSTTTTATSTDASANTIHDSTIIIKPKSTVLTRWLKVGTTGLPLLNATLGFYAFTLQWYLLLHFTVDKTSEHSTSIHSYFFKGTDDFDTVRSMGFCDANRTETSRSSLQLLSISRPWPSKLVTEYTVEKGFSFALASGILSAVAMMMGVLLICGSRSESKASRKRVDELSEFGGGKKVSEESVTEVPIIPRMAAVDNDGMKQQTRELSLPAVSKPPEVFTAVNIQDESLIREAQPRHPVTSSSTTYAFLSNLFSTVNV
ncbi:hypothetical protein HDU76_007393, partial [Blyttiomyces sp. JEL0837]